MRQIEIVRPLRVYITKPIVNLTATKRSFCMCSDQQFIQIFLCNIFGSSRHNKVKIANKKIRTQGTHQRRTYYDHKSQTNFHVRHKANKNNIKQESPAIADKPARRESMPKLLQFDVLTTLSLTILAYVHAFSCCCVRNLRNPEKFTENSKL